MKVLLQACSIIAIVTGCAVVALAQPATAPIKVLAAPEPNADTETPQVFFRFVQKLNENNLRAAAGLVADADATPEADEARKDLSQEWIRSRGTNQIVINDLNWAQRGDVREATFKVTLLDDIGNAVTQTEKLSFRPVAGTWKIAAEGVDSIYDNTFDAGNAGRFLLNMATQVAHPLSAMAKLRAVRSMNRMKQLSLSLIIYLQDNDMKIDINNASFKQKLLPLIRNETIFVTPDVPGETASNPYAFNDALKGFTLAQIKDPSKTVALYDGKDGKLNFRFDGRAVVGFLNGRVALVTEQQAKSLLWQP